MPARKPLWKSPIVIFVIIVAVIALMITLRQTYVLQTFRFNSNANAPTIGAQKMVFTSIKKKPKLFDFIVFRNTTQPGAPVWMSRVCGMAGDSIEMRRGELFVNGRPVDSSLTLSHSYLVSPKDTAGMHVEQHSVVPDAMDSVLITYPDQVMQKLGISYHRYFVPLEMVDTYMQKVFDQPWNIDNFGPVKVPDQSFFVLGDNRSNAMDSRYIGFINAKDFKGTVLNH